jgi:hypothetical protein
LRRKVSRLVPHAWSKQGNFYLFPGNLSPDLGNV